VSEKRIYPITNFIIYWLIISRVIYQRLEMAENWLEQAKQTSTAASSSVCFLDIKSHRQEDQGNGTSFIY